MDYFPSLFDTTAVKYDIWSSDSPLRMPGWQTWPQQQCESKMAQNALHIVSGTYLTDYDLNELLGFMQQLVSSLAHLLTMDLTSHFSGWFPSGYIPAFTRHLGTPLPPELLDAALSLTVMVPIHPDYPQGRAVHAARTLVVPAIGGNCFFISLHPSLYLIPSS